MGSTVTLVYDGDGNRVSKTVNGVTTKYLVDDLNPTGYPQIMDELTNGAVTRTYTYGLQRIGQYQVISNTWTPSFYGYDGFGTVRNLTNSAGAITDTYEYDAFGNEFTVSGGSNTPNEMYYRGEQWDSDLGLYYLRARYYNPITGRFMGRDPEGDDDDYDDSDDPEDWEVAADPKNLHAYLYANGDPVNLEDPTGQSAVLTVGLIDWEEVAKNTLGLTILGAEIYCAYDLLAAETNDWVDLGLNQWNGSVHRTGPCSAALNLFKEHDKGKRKSTKGKHEKGQGRRTKSRGPGTHPKFPPRKRPKGWKGPWNPSKGWGDDQ
ncbi:MAG TPA: RHS repeat-associated core domain-containing protein [Terracidiphilus sp.]|nr:RHS repeat-associated core domain-containing protein [Terracidiphilus sp.]